MVALATYSLISRVIFGKGLLNERYEWKKEQKKIKVPKKVERIIPEGFVELDGIGANDKNTLIATSDAPESTKKKKTYRKSSRTKKVQNVVSEKEIGNIVSEPIDKQES